MMAMAHSTAKNFSIDTKGCCFMCLKYDSEAPPPPTSQYSFQRLSKYLQLDLKSVYNISFPMTSISILGDSEILVSLCNNCSVTANKFVKLHKDLELIRKRVNVCVEQIYNVMQDANMNSQLIQEYRQRITLQANPLELIQASIADNLRKQTIEKCSKLNPSSATRNASTVSMSRVLPPVPLNKVSVTTNNPSPSKMTIIQNPQNESSKVSSTTTILCPEASQKKQVVLVVDLEDSDDDDDTTNGVESSELVISSVTGASGAIFSTTLNAPLRSEMQPSLLSIQKAVSINSSERQSPVTNTQPATSFSALQNFTTEFDLREFGINVNHGQTHTMVSENESWKSFSDGSSQCKLCGKLFDKGNPENLVVHSRMHAGVKPISCQHCNQKFRSAGNRRIHVLTYHRKELFSQFRYPVVSDENFQHAIDLIFERVQKFDQDADKPYTCLNCSKYYRHKIDVEAHMVNVHFNEIGTQLMEMQRQGFAGNESENPDEAVKRKCLSCNSCGLKFRQHSSLTRHLTTGCTNTNTTITATTQNDPCKSIIEQQKVMGNKPETNKNYVIKWKCGICSIVFATQGDLKRHKTMKHGTGLKLPSATESAATYKCQYCGKKFKFYYSQRVHMLTLHRYQIFSKFVPPGTTLNAIENGIQRILAQSTETTDTTHVCKFCSKDFTGSVASILQNHILVNHFQEVVNRLKLVVTDAEKELNQSAQVESTTPIDNSDNVIQLCKEEMKTENIIPESVLPD